MMLRAIQLATVVALASAALAGAAESAEKPLVSCDKVVEAYKTNGSVDETASTLMVDQTRVAQCLKAAGIATPPEADQ